MTVVVWLGHDSCMSTLCVEWWNVGLGSQVVMSPECMLCVGCLLLAAVCLWACRQLRVVSVWTWSLVALYALNCLLVAAACLF